MGPLANYREYIACTIDQMTEHDELPPCDVYTIRKKNSVVSTRELLRSAQKRDYSEIISAFCRSAYDDEDETQYYPSKENKLLDNPIFKSWEEIAEFEKAEDLKRQQQRLVKPSTFPKKKKSQLSKIKNFFKKKDSHH